MKRYHKWRIQQTDVSENSGTPKSSILIGFSIINHPFRGTTIFGNIQTESKTFTSFASTRSKKILLFTDARKRGTFFFPSESLLGLSPKFTLLVSFLLVEESLFPKNYSKKRKEKKKKKKRQFLRFWVFRSRNNFVCTHRCKPWEITAETSSGKGWFSSNSPSDSSLGSPGCVGTPGNGSYLQVNLRGCKKDSVNGDVALWMSFTKLCQGVTILSFSFARGYLILPYSRFIYCISILYLFQDTNCHLAWGTEWQTTYEHHSNYSSPPWFKKNTYDIARTLKKLFENCLKSS